MVGTIEASSKKSFKRDRLQPLYMPLQRLKLRSDSSPRRSVCSKKQHKKPIIQHAKNFLAKMLLNKKFFDFNKIYGHYKKHFDIEFFESFKRVRQFFIKYNFRPKSKRWGKLYDLRFSLCRGLQRGRRRPLLKGFLEETSMVPTIVQNSTSASVYGLQPQLCNVSWYPYVGVAFLLNK